MGLLIGVITAANHRPDSGVGEAHCTGLFLEAAEDVRVDITPHGKVMTCLLYTSDAADE